MGIAAAELLFRRMDGETGASQLVVIPTRLIERGSGEIGAGVRRDPVGRIGAWRPHFRHIGHRRGVADDTLRGSGA